MDFPIIIAPGDVVVDIGASTGYFAIPARDLGAKVLAVEPLPENCSILRDAGLEVLEAAIGATDGTCSMIMSDEAPATASFTVPGLQIRMVSLKTIIERVGGNIDVLKSNIEGGEYEAFTGASFSSVDRAVIYTHAWTIKGEPEREAVGYRSNGFRWDPDSPERLLKWLQKTHEVEQQGDLNAGCTLIARRRK